MLAVEGYTVPLESEAASKLVGSKRQQLPHSKAPAALNSCVFNQGFAYFHDSEESAPYLLLAKQIPRRFAQDDRNQTLLRSLLNTLQGFEEQ